jgi:SNF2 family DNA or RNA helicase
VQFKTTPYAHQLTAFERFKDSPYFALFADMGTGKTKMSIDIASHKFETGQIDAMLIIAPNHVHTQWVNEEFPKHCAIPYKPFIWKSGLAGSKMYKRWLNTFTLTPMENLLKVLTVNVEAFQSDTVVPFIADFVKLHKPFIVIDETTRIKTSTAKRTKTIHKLVKYGQRAILTGTPTAKSPFDLWSMMEFLKTGYFGCNYFIFQHRYGILIKGSNQFSGARYNALIDEKMYAWVSSMITATKEQRGGKLMPDDYDTIATIRGTSEKNVRFIEQNPTFTKYKRLDELRDYMAKDVYSVKKQDCLDLPDKVYERIYVDMTAEQKRIYKNLKQELMAEYDGKELTVANKVALTTRLMQIIGGFFPYMEMKPRFDGKNWIEEPVGAGQLIGAANSKMVALKADLDEVDFDSTKVIIWAHFVAELKYIYAELKSTYKCALYYGGTSDPERKRIIEDFKAGKYDIFIGNTSTAGFGLNLQNATLQYYFSNTFRTEERLQAEDRSHRIGVKSTCVYKDIIMKGTIDEHIYSNIATGRDLNDYFKSVSLDELLKIEDEAEPNEE